MLGPMKVYSAAYTGLDAPPCGTVEIYHTDQIEYIFALENPEDYKWPDAWTDRALRGSIQDDFVHGLEEASGTLGQADGQIPWRPLD